MLVSAVFFDGPKHAFHLYVQKDDIQNILMSTLPVSMIEKNCPYLLAKIRYSELTSPFYADALLQQLGSSLLNNGRLRSYYYPDYLMSNGRVSFDNAEQIMKLQEVFGLFSNSYYSRSSDPIKFYVIHQKYQLTRNQIFRAGSPICEMEFDYSYIQNMEMRIDYQHLNIRSPKFLQLQENGRVAYVLVLNEKDDLQMFVVV